MTYFGFLLRFLIFPLLIIGCLAWYTERRRPLSYPWNGGPHWLALVTLMCIALIYTTPWDNYLIATRVWWYDPALVSGITGWWVPIEEYLFMFLQPLFTGCCLLLVARWSNPVEKKTSITLFPDVDSPPIRRWATRTIGLLWLLILLLWLFQWPPSTYLCLILVWALPPVILQLSFGADILWHQRVPVLITLIATTLYLSLADGIAINLGVWTINPEQSLNIFLGGVLPFEEGLFFFMTNLLTVFGICLFLHPNSLTRIVEIRSHLTKSRLQQ